MKRFKYLKGYQFSGCAVRRANLISFFGQQWGETDALETRNTAAFFFNPLRPEETRWAYRGIGEATGIHGTAVFEPDERWLFIMDDGLVYVVGQGDDAREKNVTTEKKAFFRTVRAADGKRAYAVGTSRRAYRRDAKNKWTKLDRGLPPGAHGGDIGFEDISGFSDSEIYACGGKGDLWVFDGSSWSQIDLPTNAALWHLCCGGDGTVYIMTDQRNFLAGRGQSWRIIDQQVTEDLPEQMVWYDDRVIVSTADALYEIHNGKFAKSRLKPPEQTSYAKLAVGDGVLVVAGPNEACLYDGKQWSVILEPE